MAKINNTDDLGELLKNLSEMLKNYAPPFAEELKQIAVSLEVLEALNIKELKKLPKIVEKTKEQQEKLKQQFIIEKEKTKKIEVLQVKNLQAEKLKNKEYELEIKRLRQEISSLKKNSPGTKKTKKQKPEAEKLIEKEVLAEFYPRVALFQQQAKTILKDFFTKGEKSLELLTNLAEEFIEKEEGALLKVAAKLIYITEYGRFQSLRDGKIWDSYHLSYYPVSQEVQNTLEKAKLSSQKLQALFKLLQIGLPQSKTKNSLERALIKEISLRSSSH